MSVATMDLARATQHLIDCRLDTIDRMLLGRVSRQERLEIVREVEAQIFEQLHERGAEEPGREDVLAVLGRLDPPEAYLPEEDGELGAVPSRGAVVPRRGRSESPSKPAQWAGRVSGILALVGTVIVLLGTPVTYGLVLATNSELVLIGLGGAIIAISFVCSALGVILAAYSRLASGWSVVGLVVGILWLVVCPAAVACVFVFLG